MSYRPAAPGELVGLYRNRQNNQELVEDWTKVLTLYRRVRRSGCTRDVANRIAISYAGMYKPGPEVVLLPMRDKAEGV